METENEKLSLSNKLNNELIADIEKNAFKNNNLIHSINEMDKISELDKCNFQYKNEILIIDLKTHIKKLENNLEIKENLIEKLKEKIKISNNENLRKTFELKHHYHEYKNKEFNNILKKIQTLEQEKIALINENEKLKLNLQKLNEKNKFLENEIRSKYENIENDLISERSQKENMNSQLKEISKIYRDNQQKLMDDAVTFQDLLRKKEEENQKMQQDYEERIYHVKFYFFFFFYFTIF